MTPRRPRLTLKRLMRGMILPIVCFGFVFYFGYYGLHGNYGLFALIRLDQTVALKEQELAVVEAERDGLERRVTLLRPESVDPDMLDEQARATLGFTAPEELTILLDRPSGAGN